MTAARAKVVSSFTIVKGSLIEETYAAFREWDFALTKRENLAHMREMGVLGARANWSLNVAKVINRRFDPAGRDRPLAELAQAGCDMHVWKPILLWHMTRDEFLVRDFLVTWLYPRFAEGAFRLRPEDVTAYLQSLTRRKGIEWSGAWTERTTERVASGLLRIAADFGFLTGTTVKEFASYHLREESFLYVLHALAEINPSARAIIESEDWHMYLLDQSDVERELLRLHQFHKLRYEVAGSLMSLDLPCASLAAYAKELTP
jgi:Putative inner membrane protein (DUF1819)